jgi:anti-anti-sigma factor
MKASPLSGETLLVHPSTQEPTMEIKAITLDDAYTHVALSGKLDIAGVGEIENKFIGYTSARKQNTVVDISGLTFVGSMGLRIFLSAAKTLARDNKKLILLNPQPLVKDVLDASGIADIVSIEQDEAAALAEAQA